MSSLTTLILEGHLPLVVSGGAGSLVAEFLVLLLLPLPDVRVIVEGGPCGTEVSLRVLGLLIEVPAPEAMVLMTLLLLFRVVKDGTRGVLLLPKCELGQSVGKVHGYRCDVFEVRSFPVIVPVSEPMLVRDR